MKWSAAFAFAACLAFVSAQGVTQAEPQKPSPHTESTTSQPTTHEPPPTSAKTTEMPSTTHEPPTTTPHSKTTMPPPPPPTPAPKKEASVNSYNVTEPGTNHTCILVKAALQFRINYLTKDNQMKEALLPLDNETVVDHVLSSCSSPGGEQTLALQFGRNDSLKLSFAKNGTVYLHDVTVAYMTDPVNFPDAAKPGEKVTVRNDSFMLYSVPEDRSYHCGVDQPIYLGSNVTLDVISVQLQAFINSTTEKPAQFGAAVECSAGDISNIVPIAVGAALAALVIIVLIAYLIGRSKSRQKGYQSV
uniref:Lysosome-associated membrane glycoprotein 5 n=1 Tax=Amblyomma aureolatum TaxID=187763 RepID=A0A1E1XI30_9ACAR